MLDDSVSVKEDRIFMWDTTELAPSHPIEKEESPDQALDTKTIVSITEEAERSRSWIYTRVADENSTQPATHMESLTSAQKVKQTEAESWQFLSLPFHLFPKLL